MPYKDPEKQRAYLHAWRESHKDDITAYQRAYATEHPKDPEKQRVYRNAWRENHKDAIVAYQHRYRRTSPDSRTNEGYWKTEEYRKKRRAYKAVRRAILGAPAMQAYAKNWRKNNPGKFPAYQKKYVLAHPEIMRVARRIRKQRRRAALRGAALNDFTAAQWREMKDAYGHRCVYCGRKMQRLTMDHLTPLSKGGNHTASNIVPACHSCNSRKHAGAVLCPVQPLLLTVA